MAESAALLVDEVLPAQLVRQWMLIVPCPLKKKGKDGISNTPSAPFASFFCGG
jgi:hypothetical protein